MKEAILYSCRGRVSNDDGSEVGRRQVSDDLSELGFEADVLTIERTTGQLG